MTRNMLGMLEMLKFCDFSSTRTEETFIFQPERLLLQTRNSRSQKLQEFRSCRMGRQLSGLGMLIHTLPCDEEFDSASSRFDSICSRP